jgi:hypothetical protein
VEKWRRSWREGGLDALRSVGPVSAERLSAAQWGRLERELGRGPRAHGWDCGGGWTLVRVTTLLGECSALVTPCRGWGSCCAGTVGPRRCPPTGRSNGTTRRSRWGRPRCGRR